MLDKFIAAHEILSVGITPMGYRCTDLIVDDPQGLIDRIAGTNYYISQINWWELTPIAAGGVLGMGGPRDPRAPEEQFFSEIVHLSKEFNATSTVEDYRSYIARVKLSYPDADLYPGFDIVAK